MQSALVHLSLIPAPADLRIASGPLQLQFSRFRNFLRVRGVPASTPMFYRDTDTDAGGYAGEFVIPLVSATEPPLETMLVAWLQARPGRRVNLRICDGQVEARSVEEARAFLWSALKLRQAPLALSEDVS
jgi:hypothetical protein